MALRKGISPKTEEENTEDEHVRRSLISKKQSSTSRFGLKRGFRSDSEERNNKKSSRFKSGQNHSEKQTSFHWEMFHEGRSKSQGNHSVEIKHQSKENQDHSGRFGGQSKRYFCYSSRSHNHSRKSPLRHSSTYHSHSIRSCDHPDRSDQHSRRSYHPYSVRSRHRRSGKYQHSSRRHQHRRSGRYDYRHSDRFHDNSDTSHDHSYSVHYGHSDASDHEASDTSHDHSETSHHDHSDISPYGYSDTSPHDSSDTSHDDSDTSHHDHSEQQYHHGNLVKSYHSHSWRARHPSERYCGQAKRYRRHSPEGCIKTSSDSEAEFDSRNSSVTERSRYLWTQTQKRNVPENWNQEMTKSDNSDDEDNESNTSSDRTIFHSIRDSLY